MAESLLKNLDEIDGIDLPLIGSKAYRLATLKQSGFNVPQGMVLTTKFFESQLKAYHLVPLWAGSPDIAVTTESLHWLANTLKTRPLAKELLERLNTKIDQTFNQEINSFAVRSSAIDEDQREHTFAGIHLTELGVPRSVLPVAITRCWASALNEPALKYRQTHGMSIQSIRLALIIQPMLMPSSSGVAFTLNPLTGAQNEIVIEATWGLSQTLVSGEIQPYYYRLSNQSPDYPLIEQRGSDIARPSGENNDGNVGPLSEHTLAPLAKQLKQIQALMGEAQDIEWAKQDDTFYFLQTRPVSLPPPPRQNVDQEWTRGSHPEFLPELPSPLFGSLLERTQGQATIFFRELGLKVDGLGPYVKLILGRPYLNLTMLKRVIAQVGVNPGSVLHTIGHTEPGAKGDNLSIDWETAWKKRGVYWLILKRALRSRSYLNGYKATIDKVVKILKSTAGEPDLTASLAQLQQHERVYGELFNTNLGLASSISAITAIGSSLIAPFTDAPAALLSAMALKGVKTADGQLNQALLELAYLARQEEEVLNYLSDAPPDFHDYQENLANFTEFNNRLANLMSRYGQRAVYEADVGWPRYADDPSQLLNVIRRYALSKDLPNYDQRSRLTSDAVTATWAALGTKTTGTNRFFPWRRWLAAYLVRFLHRQLVMRDELNAARARGMAACRQWDLVLGQQWVDRKWLAQPEDIFWLTLDEIERTLIAEQDMGITLSSIVQARQETYQTYAETEMPFNLQESQIASIQLGTGLSPEATPEVMMGMPISPGQVRGTVLVVRNPKEFKRLADDIILVMPSTDPAWLPLLHLATGLIVEMGGLLSHGSVIAREYGLPAVANIPQATKRLRTGDSVLIDGSTGIVQLL